MKFLIGKYNAHPGQDKPEDKVTIQFPMSMGDTVAKVLGFDCWEKVQFQLVCEVATGYTMRRGPDDGSLVTLGRWKLNSTKKEPNPERQLGFGGTDKYLAGLTLMPEFGRGWVGIIPNRLAQTIFIPNIPEDERRPVRKHGLGKPKKVDAADPTTGERLARTFHNKGVPGEGETTAAPQRSSEAEDIDDVIAELAIAYDQFNVALRSCHEAGLAITVAQLGPSEGRSVVLRRNDDGAAAEGSREELQQRGDQGMEKTFTMRLQREKETKGCYRYAFHSGDAGVDTVYLRKEHLDEPAPPVLQVSIQG